MTNVYVLPLRNPFVVAKAVGTAAYLTGNRVRLGVGAGWMREEFELLGQDVKDVRRDPGIHLQSNHGAESPTPDSLLDRFQEIVAFQFLNRRLRIARDVERMSFLDFEAREKRLQIGDDLFQAGIPDTNLLACLESL